MSNLIDYMREPATTLPSACRILEIVRDRKIDSAVDSTAGINDAIEPLMAAWIESHSPEQIADEYDRNPSTRMWLDWRLKGETPALRDIPHQMLARIAECQRRRERTMHPTPNPNFVISVPAWVNSMLTKGETL